jgi:hypothetical protein
VSTCVSSFTDTCGGKKDKKIGIYQLISNIFCLKAAVYRQPEILPPKTRFFHLGTSFSGVLLFVVGEQSGPPNWQEDKGGVVTSVS